MVKHELCLGVEPYEVVHQRKPTPAVDIDRHAAGGGAVHRGGHTGVASFEHVVGKVDEADTDGARRGTPLGDPLATPSSAGAIGATNRKRSGWSRYTDSAKLVSVR